MFVFFAIVFGLAMLFLAWLALQDIIDDSTWDGEDSVSLSSPAPVTPCDTNQQGDNNG